MSNTDEKKRASAVSKLPTAVLGVGIDMVDIKRIQQFDDILNSSFCRRGFSEHEQAEAAQAAQPATYLAGRFAVKEAVFKAVAHLTSAKNFDFRCVETHYREDKSPYVYVNEKLRPILADAGVDELLISISNEGDFAIAICQAIAYIH